MSSSENGAEARRGLSAARTLPWLLIAVVALAWSAMSQSLAAQSTSVTPVHSSRAAPLRREMLQAQLGGGFVTQAEYVAPARQRGLVPAVLLIHGSTPADLDFTVARRGRDTTRVFRDIAESLARGGVASLRYHKRCVRGPGNFDQACFMRTDLQALLADARVMLDSLRNRPGVDPSRIYVWGWSEGSTIAAQMAAHDAIAGAIAHGPVVTTFHETLGGQFERVGLPYLLPFAAADSTIDFDGITRAEQGNGGLLARSHATLLLDPFALQRGERKLNAYVDADSSGRIHLTREALATYRRFFTDGPMLGMYSSARALPGWGIMADSSRVPVLVLHGTEDANIPVADVRRLAAQEWGNPLITLRIIRGLGHSLGPAANPIDDDFRPVAPVAMREALRWIRKRD